MAIACRSTRAVIVGAYIQHSNLAPYFTFSREGIIIAIAIYGFVASVLPVWLLLTPRDYLSSYMKIGTIAVLVGGVIIVHPDLKMPAMTSFVQGGGPIIPGKLFPFVFVTIACGAISGFHALVSSGTTPKMLNKESDARMIGYGAMLMEGVVGIVALIASCSLFPGDYFAINLSPEKFTALGIPITNLAELSREVGETVAGRPGGAVSLAVGFAQIFTGIPGMKSLMAYWYHFAIMFEALFILTTIDAGTRISRFLVQEFVGKLWKPMGKTDWIPGTLISTTVVVYAWAYFIWNGSISTIWPMFGTANQLLAGVALAVASSAIINAGKVRYVWVTLIPMLFVTITTLVAGWEVYNVHARALLNTMFSWGSRLISGGMGAGREPMRGMVDTDPLRQFLTKVLERDADGRFPGIADNIHMGRLRAVALSATSVFFWSGL